MHSKKTYLLHSFNKLLLYIYIYIYIYVCMYNGKYVYILNKIF